MSGIVLHTGEGTKKSDLKRLTDDSAPPRERVSAHYYVDKKLNVYQLVDPKWEAWHAGVSEYQGRHDWNTFSVGIETEHKQGQAWAPGQQDTIAELCRHLITTYSIKQQWIAAHRWIAPQRKSDPTDWPNDELYMWINNLYVHSTYRLPGIEVDMPCGQGFHDFYYAQGGFSFFGFALTPEAKDVDTINRECTWMRFERAVFKYVYGDGVHLALLVEAINKHWAI